MGGLLALAFAAGMVAPVNPCGFALLPAWISLTAGNADTAALPTRLSRALLAGLALTLGFAGTLVVVGLIVSAGAHAIIDAAPWLGLILGVVLLVLGLVMLTGRSLGLRVPGRSVRPRAGRHGAGQSILYGIGFAAASLACTSGLLLAVIAQSQATATYTGLLVVFAAYAAGSATILLLLAIATALAGSALTRWAASMARFGPRITAIVLVLTGAYLAWYWYPAAVTGGSSATGNPMARFAATVATWVQSHGQPVAVAATVAVLSALILVVVHRKNRHRPASPAPASSETSPDPEDCCAPALSSPDESQQVTARRDHDLG
ncbi:cytochrome C biogenesis protein CcdA [Nocardioides phosphati]|uniref:Cytochrome C biogenesis protein CcdA n=1 Tax=Nocardioides phosphati TaxID=1867775 RepID=A0ABQ2N6M1_9ACTN|nr:cytochrome c biogenesis protein CcdA [Nocardioides phosphati]GGO85123.1 cytochrome C biogenesis protein CcdA [Nocardioides phosphati]